MQTKRVDFYILSTTDVNEHLLFLCKFIEKIYLKNHKLFAYCDTETQAHQLDEFLWTFRADSFIPHHLQDDGPTPPPPIQIGTKPPSKQFRDLLLNQTPTYPDFSLQFQRVIEVIYEDEQIKQTGREKYRAYQSQGWAVFTHKIDVSKEIARDTA
jgi:DNA polymerase-3 subunit chi